MSFLPGAGATLLSEGHCHCLPLSPGCKGRARRRRRNELPAFLHLFSAVVLPFSAPDDDDHYHFHRQLLMRHC